MFPQILFPNENSKDDQESHFLENTPSIEWTIFIDQQDWAKYFNSFPNSMQVYNLKIFFYNINYHSKLIVWFLSHKNSRWINTGCDCLEYKVSTVSLKVLNYWHFTPMQTIGVNFLIYHQAAIVFIANVDSRIGDWCHHIPQYELFEDRFSWRMSWTKD